MVSQLDTELRIGIAPSTQACWCTQTLSANPCTRDRRFIAGAGRAGWVPSPRRAILPKNAPRTSCRSRARCWAATRHRSGHLAGMGVAAAGRLCRGQDVTAGPGSRCPRKRQHPALMAGQGRGETDEALRIRREEQLPVFERAGDVRERSVTLQKIADGLIAAGAGGWAHPGNRRCAVRFLQHHPAAWTARWGRLRRRPTFRRKNPRSVQAEDWFKSRKNCTDGGEQQAIRVTKVLNGFKNAVTESHILRGATRTPEATCPGDR